MPEGGPEILETLPGTGRVEAFTDGVFAVVATLLVLDLHVPALPANPSFAALLRAMTPLRSTLLSFTLAFLFVMIVWVNHHQIFHALARADRGLLWSNNFLLFCMCLLPFPTAFLGAYPTLPIAPFLLSLVLGAAAIAIFILARHAESAGLYREDVHEQSRRAIRNRSFVGPPAFAVTALLAFISPLLSIAGMFVVMAYYGLPARIAGRSESASNDRTAETPA